MKRILFLTILLTMPIWSQGIFHEGQRLQVLITCGYPVETKQTFNVYYMIDGIQNIINTASQEIVLPVINSDVTVWATALDSAKNESVKSNSVFMDYQVSATNPAIEYTADPQKLYAWKNIVLCTHQITTDSKGNPVLRHWLYDSRPQSVKQKTIFLAHDQYRVSVYGSSSMAFVKIKIDGKDYPVELFQESLVRLPVIELAEANHLFEIVLNQKTAGTNGIVDLYSFEIRKANVQVDGTAPGVPGITVNVID